VLSFFCAEGAAPKYRDDITARWSRLLACRNSFDFPVTFGSPLGRIKQRETTLSETVVSLDASAVPFTVVTAFAQLNELLGVVLDPRSKSVIVGSLTWCDKACARACVDIKSVNLCDVDRSAIYEVVSFVRDDDLGIRAIELFGDDTLTGKPRELWEWLEDSQVFSTALLRASIRS
jgi:hypothetical protein